MQWNLFQNLQTVLIAPIMAQMQSMLAQICTTTQPIAVVMVLIWLGFLGFDIANGKPLQAAMKDFFIAAMVIGALQLGQYSEYVSTFFLQAVPNTLSAALGGAGTPVAVLDHVLDAAVTATFKTYDALPSYSLKSIPLALMILIFLVMEIASVGFTFAIYMISTIINVLAIVIGPVFLALGAVPFSRRFASGWLAILVGGCTTQLLTQAVVQLLSGAENTMLQQVVVSAAASDSNSIAMIWGLAQCALLLALSYAVVRRIPEIAHAIAGGVYHGSQGAHASTFGVAGVAASMAATGGRAAAGAAGANSSRQIGAGAVRAAASKPAGASLSSAAAKGP